MGKLFEVFRTYRGSVTMPTIYVVMFGKSQYAMTSWTISGFVYELLGQLSYMVIEYSFCYSGDYNYDFRLLIQKVLHSK